MRGKVFGMKISSPPLRITPAHAGKRLAHPLPVTPPQDHPRPCGEKTAHRSLSVHDTGSPPPMRGKVRTLSFTSYVIGITPAHAGKSPPHAVKCPYPEDHPRPCGEKTIKPTATRGTEGSPPPMRGKEDYHEY